MEAGSPGPLRVGRIVAGRYAILQRLGQGGGGGVWLAEDLLRDRRLVALKSIVSSTGAEALSASIKQEFRVLTQLRHPNLIRVFDSGKLGGAECYLTEEYIDGETLQQLVGRFPMEHIELLCAELLRAMDFLLRKNVLHRDIKPSNVMVQWRVDAETGAIFPHIKLLDFGLAVLGGQGDAGLAGGTRRFMAPEVRLGRGSDAVSELFSLAATVFCVVTGEPPLGEVVSPTALLRSDPVSFEDFPPSVPPNVRGVLKRMLALSRHGRYANAREALDDLIFRSNGRLVDTVAEALPLDEGALISRMDMLNEMLGRYRSGERVRWILIGPPGFGKRRIAREFEIQGQLMERTTFRVDVSPGNPPYVVPVELCQQFNRLLNEEDEGELFGSFNTPGGASFSTFNTAFEPAMLRILAELSLADESPIVIIEDIDLADDYSLEILARWCGTDAPFCMLATAQSVPDQLASVMEVLHLRPLTRQEVRDFMEDSFGSVDVSDGQLEALLEKSGGSPANLRAICTELLRRGLLAKGAGEVWRLEKLPEGFGADVEGAFEHSLESISPAGVLVLDILSVMERPVSEKFLSNVVGHFPEHRSVLADDYFHRLLCELELRSFLHIDRKQSQSMIRPPGDRLIKIVRVRLEEARLETLHRAIGLQLSADWTRDEGAGAREVAYHLQRGKCRSQANVFENIAAVEAMKVGAIQRAQEHLRYARTGLDNQGERAYLRLFEGILAVRGGDPDNARTFFVQAGQISVEGYVCFLAHLYQTRIAIEFRHFDVAQDKMRLLARRWPSLSSTFLMERLRGSFAVATLHFDAGHLAYTRAYEKAIEQGWNEGAFTARLEVGSCLLGQGRLAAAEKVFRALIKEASCLNTPQLQGRTWANWGWLLYLKGDMENGSAGMRRGLEYLQEDGQFSGIAAVLTMLAIVSIELEDFSQAIAHIRSATRLRHKSGRGNDILLLSSLNNLVRVKAGEEVEASLIAMDKIHRKVRLLADPLKEVRSALVFSRGLILADRVNQARRLLMGNLEILANTPTGEHMLRVLTLTLLDEVSSETSL